MLDEVVYQTLPTEIEATNANIWAGVLKILFGEPEECVDKIGLKYGLAQEHDKITPHTH